MPDQTARPLDALEATIRERAERPSEKSYTSRLLTGGVDAIGAKVIEEAGELVEAASEPGDAGRSHFVYEAGDLVYHTLVLLRARGVELAEVEAELAKRFGVSGITEKAKRRQAGSEQVEGEVR
ncbi:Phosphoribosyl-ATP pyrophosphatase [Pirellulimonas nuda]|uniref:Phosphoribosyl-ATP pyrophosphatase n=1 Tax=Pirellulimonas nuda TaxID=2528009 RepID=A0A518DGH6_9BACT|nr:phosphoribosyl-ATP diphosphatase [Pirellulimonas nuda]QDU90576.1 Phosphoribosyl-ATP pyrophosphatase [Pirellulimonas nuda]